MPRSKASKSCSGNVLITQHASPLGPLWAHWTTKGLHQLSWQTPASDHVQQVPSVHTKQSSMLDTLLQDYFKGKNVPWHDIVLDPTGWTPFTERVYEHCLKIPFGNTITYKELAGLAGSERASRAVGAAMSRNRILLIIPCHRVVSTSGNLQGYSAKGGINTKHLLLELERQGQWPHNLFDKEQNR